MTLSILPRGLFYIFIHIHILPSHSSKELICTTEISKELSDYPPLGPKMLTRLTCSKTEPHSKNNLSKLLPLYAKKAWTKVQTFTLQSIRHLARPSHTHGPFPKMRPDNGTEVTYIEFHIRELFLKLCLPLQRFFFTIGMDDRRLITPAV